jgi:hypothetical protein
MSVVSLAAVLCSCAMTLRRVRSYPFPRRVEEVQISSDGATVALALTGNGRCCVVCCDSRSGECRSCVEVPGEPSEIRLSGDCSTWAAVLKDGRIEFGRAASNGRWPADLSGQSDGPPVADVYWGVNLSASGAVAAASRGRGDSTTDIVVFDVATGRPLQTFRLGRIGPEGCVMRLSAGGTRLAASWCGEGASRRWESAIWDTRTGRRIAAPDNAAAHLAWLGDDALASIDACDRPIKFYCGPYPPIYRAAVRRLPTGETRTFACRDNELTWSTQLAADPGGDTLAITMLHGCRVVLLDGATMKPLSSLLKTGGEEIHGLALSRGGREAALVCGAPRGYTGPVRPFPVFIVDTKTGAARELRPDCHTAAKSVIVLVVGGLATGACVWLLWRTAPRWAPVPELSPERQYNGH